MKIDRSQKVKQMKSACVVLQLLAPLIWSGCSTQVNVLGLRDMPSLLAPDEGVAVVASDKPTDFIVEAEVCVSKALKEAFPSLRVISSDDFNRAAFPVQPSGTTVRGPTDFILLLKDNGFRERVNPLGLHYLILIGGETEQKTKPTGVATEVLLTGVGVEWDRISGLNASILDLKTDQSVGSVWVEASGNPTFACIGFAVPLGGCIPLVIAAFTESEACGSFGASVTKFPKGEDLPQPRTPLRIASAPPFVLAPQLPAPTTKIGHGQKLLLTVVDSRRQYSLGNWQRGDEIRTSNSLKTAFDEALRKRFSDLGFEIVDSPVESSLKLKLIIEHFEVQLRSDGWVYAQVIVRLDGGEQRILENTYIISHKIDRQKYSPPIVEETINRTISDIIVLFSGEDALIQVKN